MKIYVSLIYINLLLYFHYGFIFSKELVFISQVQAQEIGQKIWFNECSGSIAKLTHWNEGEEFPSFGIGHFIWFPKHIKIKKSEVIFDEQFPQMRAFLAQHGKVMPTLFQGSCPWKTRDEFMRQINSQKMNLLRDFLVETIDLQARYIVHRFNKSLDYLLSQISPFQRMHVLKQIKRMATSGRGVYAMVDYLNFKGEGLKSSEAYFGKRWGLLQLLTKMHGDSLGDEPRKEFAQAAREVLAQRVQNSPKERNEARWLPGWLNRIDSYE